MCLPIINFPTHSLRHPLFLFGRYRPIISIVLCPQRIKPPTHIGFKVLVSVNKPLPKAGMAGPCHRSYLFGRCTVDFLFALYLSIAFHLGTNGAPSNLPGVQWLGSHHELSTPVILPKQLSSGMRGRSRQMWMSLLNIWFHTASSNT